MTALHRASLPERARAVGLLLRDCGRWHTTGSVTSLAADSGLLDDSNAPLTDVDVALHFLQLRGHVACRHGLWGVTAQCRPIDFQDDFSNEERTVEHE